MNKYILTKLGNGHTCESAIYTHQNYKADTTEMYHRILPSLWIQNPELLNAGNYLVLGNFPLPWNYFFSQTDEIPKPIHGGVYVILKIN